MMSALPLASARLIKMWILCRLNDLLDGDLCKKYLLFPYFPFFLVLKYDFIRCVDFIRRSRIEYLISTENFLVLKFDEKYLD